MKKLLLIIFLIGITTTQAQIEFSAYQDLKLATQKDDAGNEPFTTDLVVLVKLYNGGTRADNWSKNIFAVVDVEYASLSGGEFWRYGLGFGYEFQLPYNFKISPSIDYGIINRWNRAFSSFNGLIDLTYMVSDKIGVSALASLTQRKELKWKYNDDKLVQGFYLGVKYKI